MAVFSCFLWQCFKSCYKQCNESEEDETDARLDRATRRLEMSLRMSEVSREVENSTQGETNNSYQHELNIRLELQLEADPPSYQEAIKLPTFVEDDSFPSSSGEFTRPPNVDENFNSQVDDTNETTTSSSHSDSSAD